MSRSLVRARNFRSFTQLAAAYEEGVDYRITCVPHANATVGIVAPHGGSIEAHTSEIASAIAGEDFSLYLLEGIRPSGNYAALHLTSHYFDEPKCLGLLATCEDVVTIHGCKVPGEVVLVGGLDNELSAELCKHIAAAGLECHLDGHDFLGRQPTNICNRGRRGIGVQLELSVALRMSSAHKRHLVAAVREVLLRREARRQP